MNKKQILQYLLILLLAAGTSIFLHREGTQINRLTTDENTATLVRPGFVLDTDDEEWVMQAEDAAEHHKLRIRNVPDDNWPLGRENQWPSPFLWLILGCSWLYSTLYGIGGHEAIYQGACLVNPLIFFLFAAGIAPFSIKRFGFLGSIFLVFGVIWTYRGSVDYLGIRPAHHALTYITLIVFLVTSILCSQERKKWSFLFWISSISAAISTWLGPLSTLPLIAAWGVGTMATTIWGSKESRDFGYWKIWGSCTAGLLLVAEAIEYLPGIPPLRMEIANITYIAGFFGAGFLLSATEIAKDQGFSLREEKQQTMWAIGTLAAAVPVIVLAIGKGAVLSTMETTLGRLMQNIAECVPTKVSDYTDYTLLLVPALILAVVIWQKRKQLETELIIAAAFFIASMALSFQFQRMLPYSFIGISIFMAFIAKKLQTGKNGLSIEKVCFTLSFFGLLLSLERGLVLHNGEVRMAGQGAWIGKTQRRAFCWSLLDDARKGHINPLVVIAPPDLGTELAYYTGAKTVDRIFWECKDGIDRYNIAMASPKLSDLRDLVDETGASYVIAPGKGWGQDTLLYVVHGSEAYSKHYANNMEILQDPKTRPAWLTNIPGVSGENGVVQIAGTPYIVLKVVAENKKPIPVKK